MTQAALSLTINLTDVDLVQVNFSRFFGWMDAGYGELLRAAGHPLSTIIAAGFATPAVDARCEYRRPLSLDDAFRLRSAVSRIGRTSYTVGHRFEDDRGVFAVGRTVHVWIRARPAQVAESVPSWLADIAEPDFLSDLESL